MNKISYLNINDIPYDLMAQVERLMNRWFSKGYRDAEQEFNILNLREDIVSSVEEVVSKEQIEVNEQALNKIVSEIENQYKEGRKFYIQNKKRVAMNIFDNLIKIANNLDNEGLIVEADMVTEVMTKLAQDEDSYLLTRLAQVTDYDDAMQILKDYAAEEGRKYREFLRYSELEGGERYTTKDLKQEIEFGLSVEWDGFPREVNNKIFQILDSFNKKRSGGIGDDDEPYNSGKVWSDVNALMRFFAEGVMKGNLRGRKKADNSNALKTADHDYSSDEPAYDTPRPSKGRTCIRCGEPSGDDRYCSDRCFEKDYDEGKDTSDNGIS